MDRIGVIPLMLRSLVASLRAGDHVETPPRISFAHWGRWRVGPAVKTLALEPEARQVGLRYLGDSVASGPRIVRVGDADESAADPKVGGGRDQRPRPLVARAPVLVQGRDPVAVDLPGRRVHGGEAAQGLAITNAPAVLIDAEVSAEEQPRVVPRQRHALHVPDRGKPPETCTRVAFVEAERRKEIPPGSEAAVEPGACCGEVPRRLKSLDRPAWDLPRVQITRGSVKARHALSRTPPAVGATHVAERAPHEDRPPPWAEFQGSHLVGALGVLTRWGLGSLRLPMAIERPGGEAERRQILARRSVDLGESSASVEFAVACFEREYVGCVASHLRREWRQHDSFGVSADRGQVLPRLTLYGREVAANVHFAVLDGERANNSLVPGHLRSPRANGGAGLDVDGRHVLYGEAATRLLPHPGELAPDVEHITVSRERCGVDLTVRHICVIRPLRQGQGGGGAEDGLYHHPRGQNGKGQEESSVRRLSDQFQSSAHLYRALHKHSLGNHRDDNWDLRG